MEHAREPFPAAASTAISVVDPMESVVAVESGGLTVADGWDGNARRRTDGGHTAAVALAADRGVELDAVTAVGAPGRTIAEYGDEPDVDYVVVGSHGRSGVGRVIQGSVAEYVPPEPVCP